MSANTIVRQLVSVTGTILQVALEKENCGTLTNEPKREEHMLEDKKCNENKENE